ncbi:hypothetical protein COX58_00010 [archaeon CG_4_10_14_0_2_um_filter_Archaea_38_6]|nr:MAG: hypothetical protein COS83_04590 [archaeon CG07_land_8_20_14_0_80_38_8]PIU88683.1 MAG: hypothetical protein COS64_02915 [archaeon CG06_land_8_20_14_3_00_37_11]PJA23190.1 MAG: hypothetical protein COX58_00010 [archaeon CG_4_10_14_0_2_um_filter_Archaea_38_6]
MRVSRNQLNIASMKVNVKKLMSTIKSLLEGFNYDASDTSYKYQGEGDKVDMVQFLVVGSKNVDAYTKFVISVEATVENAKRLIEKDKTFVKGRGKIIFKSELILDYDEKWSKDPVLHFFKGIYEKYVYKDTRKDYETKISSEMFEVRDEVKKLAEVRK